LKGVGINAGKPPELASPVTPLSWDERPGWPRNTRPSPTCYHVIFGSSAYAEWTPKIGERWGIPLR